MIHYTNHTAQNSHISHVLRRLEFDMELLAVSRKDKLQKHSIFHHLSWLLDVIRTSA